MNSEEKQNGERERPSQKEKTRIGTMDVILVVVGVSLLAFTVAMIWIFREYGAIPDTLVTCVFAALGGECGVMGWIKTTKDRSRERKWEQEDKQQTAQEPKQEPMAGAEERPHNNL